MTVVAPRVGDVDNPFARYNSRQGGIVPVRPDRTALPDPIAKPRLAVYGTNCLKFGTEEPGDARRWLTRELHVVQPKLVVAMGSETVAFLDDLDFPLSDAVDVARPGEIQPFTPTIDALVTPDIDASLDEQDAKTRFWNAFKALGAWWSELPPY